MVTSLLCEKKARSHNQMDATNEPLHIHCMERKLHGECECQCMPLVQLYNALASNYSIDDDFQWCNRWCFTVCRWYRCQCSIDSILFCWIRTYLIIVIIVVVVMRRCKLHLEWHLWFKNICWINSKSKWILWSSPKHYLECQTANDAIEYADEDNNKRSLTKQLEFFSWIPSRNAFSFLWWYH